MNGLLNTWLRPLGTGVVLLAVLCLSPAVLAQAGGQEQLFTLLPPSSSVKPASQDVNRGSSYADGMRNGGAPIRSVPAPLTPIPYGVGAAGSPSNPGLGSLPGNGQLVPGKTYYFDSAGRPLRTPPFGEGSAMAPAVRPSAVRPKFDYSLAPIQPAARPMRNFVSRMAVAAESAAASRPAAAASLLVRQDKIVSADDVSSRRNHASMARNDRANQGQGPILSNVRRVVTIENGQSRSFAQSSAAPPAPKCPNCGKRKPIANVATSGTNVRR